jgi:Holliday junction DNA helicase RuvA
MIAALTGTLTDKLPNRLTVSVQGVGYDVIVPLSTFYYLPDLGSTVSLQIHTHVREDAIQLYGFTSRPEKEFFLLLLGVTGVGPKVALGLLSGLSVADLAGAIGRGDLIKITSVPGVGQKTAARLVLELKEKVLPYIEADRHSAGDHDRDEDRLQRDVLSALTNLGYQRQAAREVVRQVWGGQSQPLSVERLLKESLKVLSK